MLIIKAWLTHYKDSVYPHTCECQPNERERERKRETERDRERQRETEREGGREGGMDGWRKEEDYID